MNKLMKILMPATFFLCSGLILWFISNYTASRMFAGPLSYLGGPTGDYYSPVEMMWWIIIFTPIWCLCGWILDIDTRYAKLALYRYNPVQRWWLLLIGKIYILNLLYFTLFAALLKLRLGQAMDLSMIMSIFIQMLHSLAMLALMVWTYILFKKTVLSISILIVGEAFSKTLTLMGVVPSLNPLVWGMAGYTEKNWTAGGFNLMTITILQLIFTATVIVLPIHFKNLILRSVED